MTDQPTIPVKTYEGVSDQGNFEEALAKAISAAKASRNIVMWKLHEVSGERGSFANANKVTVTIQVDEPIA